MIVLTGAKKKKKTNADSIKRKKLNIKRIIIFYSIFQVPIKIICKSYTNIIILSFFFFKRSKANERYNN